LKKNKHFVLPFIGIESIKNLSVLYHDEGHHSIILEISNPILKNSGNEILFYDYHRTFLNVAKILGEEFLIQKQDIFFDAKYCGKKSDDYLSNRYFEHFEGRKYRAIKTYLTITKRVKKGKFYTYNEKDFDLFITKCKKVISLLKDSKFNPKNLTEKEITLLLKRFVAFSFDSEIVKVNNIGANDERLKIGEKFLKTISLVDIDEINFPSKIKPFSNENYGYEFPVDLLSFLVNTPDVETLVYNQVISISSQKTELNDLEKKKKRHSSMPDPANVLAEEDITSALANIARDNDLLVNTHFSIMVFGSIDSVTTASNFIGQALFRLGILPSENSYNQYELYQCAIPGNAISLMDYDFFKITLTPAMCLLYKENRQVDDDSKFQIYFADRSGIPVAVDTNDLPMTTNRISNRNKFVLGPSGTGKSFFVNDLVRQYFLYDMDVILVDTGHSYSGLCDYYHGRYITYSEKDPITMNPFKITKAEYNEEKRQFLKSLIILLWKGADGVATQTEDTAINNCIFLYYKIHFSNVNSKEADLSLNSFYEFSCVELEAIVEREQILFDVKSYRFILKKFYRGGEYDSILNSDVDATLFDEKFIVFEIDAIKDHKILFPITTIIIMDVFLQKMRHKNNRKALIIEEAWKAIASPNMAGYIVYLYKTVRKFWGEAVVVTQELEDIISNEIVKNSIISNSDTIVLLDQTKFRENYDQVSELLNLSRVERNKIFTINQLDNKSNRNRFKEFYIKRGDSGEVYGAEVSIYQYLTYTTEKKEKDALSVYLERFGTYEEALDSFVDDLTESKMSISDFADKINLETNTIEI
jgi:conjugation system TraG family ATPase